MVFLYKYININTISWWVNPAIDNWFDKQFSVAAKHQIITKLNAIKNVFKKCFFREIPGSQLDDGNDQSALNITAKYDAYNNYATTARTLAIQLQSFDIELQFVKFNVIVMILYASNVIVKAFCGFVFLFLRELVHTCCCWFVVYKFILL